MEKIGDLSRPFGAMNRRSFIKLSGLLGLGITSTGLIPATAEAVKFNKKTYKVSKTRLAMGTFVSMTLIHSSRDRAEEALGWALEEIDRLTGLMNRFDETTAVAQLNRDGYLNDVPSEIIQVVARALYHNRLSRGTFDITIKPLVDLFKEKFGGKQKVTPNAKEIKQAIKLIDSGLSPK